VLFTSNHFLFIFLPAAVALHYLATRLDRGTDYGPIARRVFFALTIFFYGYGHWWWVIPFAVSVAFDFLWAHLLGATQNERFRRLWLMASLTQNVGLLALFKYRTILIPLFSTLPACLRTPLLHATQSIPDEIPAGISFYTFESLSFVIDIYRREIQPPRRASDFFSFIAMFPRFIAGPIVRYKSMVAQFSNYRGPQIEAGLCLFAVGFFLKSVFADNFALFADQVFQHSGSLAVASAGIGVVAFGLQLYFDFCGYSLMAVGIGKCFGFTFPTNFRQPYLAGSLQEFWQRWHISLSEWMRDYLFNPLALYATRRSPAYLYAAIFTTMVMIGFWHGPHLTFVLMGAWHGFFLAVEHRFALTQRLNRQVHYALMLMVVFVGWVFFRATSMSQVQNILVGLMTPGTAGLSEIVHVVNFQPVAAACCVLGFLYCFGIEKHLNAAAWEGELPVGWGRRIAATAMVIFSLQLDAAAAAIPFLYFQF
jgi:alginate O-acetyltransferase complex protein AlgI